MRRCGDLGTAGGCAAAPPVQARGSPRFPAVPRAPGSRQRLCRPRPPARRSAWAPGGVTGPGVAVRGASDPRLWRSGCLGGTGRGTAGLGAAWRWPRGEPDPHPLGRQGAGQRAAGKEWWDLLAEGGGGGASYRSGQVSFGRLREGAGPLPRAQGGTAEPMCVRSEGLGCRHLAMSGHGLGTVA